MGPYMEENVDLTNYDQSNENSFNRELRARKRKGSELNIQPSKLKVNFAKDNDSAKVLDMTEPLIVKQNRLNRKKKKGGMMKYMQYVVPPKILLMETLKCQKGKKPT